MPTIDDLFPERPRTLYETNPLIEVICQVRFPPILRIEAAAPAEFQEQIRDKFPLLERTSNQFAQQLPQELLQAIGAPSGGSGFIFRTAERDTSATLLSDCLTVSTEKYVRWEDFWMLAQACITALIDVYAPSFFTRLGLRYRNMIRRSELGQDDAAWSALVSQAIFGELADGAWEASVVEARRSLRCEGSDDGDAVIFQHGLAQIEGQNEQCYLIDFDYYRDSRVESAEIEAVFQRFNRRSGRAFRWAITEQLHDALGPKPL